MKRLFLSACLGLLAVVLVSVLLVAALLSGPSLSTAALSLTLGDPGNENGAIYSTGPNSTIRALTFDSAGNLYVGGDFAQAGGVTVTRVTRFDGATWLGFGSGLSGGTNRVQALAVVSETLVYAGGTFNLSASTPVTGVAKWDGAAWGPLCNGANCGVSGGTLAVNALAVDSVGNLYAGGTFTTAGGVSANRVAQWDGTQWSALGSGFDNGVVNALVVSGTTLYAGGTFTATGGVVIYRVAQWDGATWSALGTNGPDGSVSALAVDSAGNLYAAGSFPNLGGGVVANGVAKWDGATWSALCNGETCGVTAASTARTLAMDSADNVYTCGSFTQAGGVTVNYIAKWNGSAWSALGSGLGNNNACNVLAFRVGYLYAGGGSLQTGGAWGIPGAGLSSSQRLMRWTAAEGRKVGGTGDYVFYPPTTLVTVTLPVTVAVTTQGDLARINIQRFNTNHPAATVPLQTGYYWQIEGLDASGLVVTGGFAVNLTLTANGFTPDVSDRVCYYTGSDWNCAMNSYDATSITRHAVTSLSDWATGNFVPFYHYFPRIMRQWTEPAISAR
jgi:hypothetical protein